MNKKNNQILFVSKDLNSIGGVQSINKLTVLKIRELNNVQAELFSFSNSLDNKKIISKLVQLFLDLISFIKVVSRKKYSVVFSVTGYEIILFCFVCFFIKRRYVFWEHGHPSFFEGKNSVKILKKIFYKKADAIVVLHPKYARSGFVGKYKFIPNFQNLENSIKINNSSKKSLLIKKVAWVGRFSKEKQPTLAYEALLIAARKNSTIDFRFIHTPFQNHMCMPSVSNFEVVDGMYYKYKEYLDENTLLIQTSTIEGMPGVIFEAIEMGAKILSTDSTPWLNDIKSEYDLTTVSPDISPEELSNVILDLIDEGNSGWKVDEQSSVLLKEISELQIAGKWEEILD